MRRCSQSKYKQEYLSGDSYRSHSPDFFCSNHLFEIQNIHQTSFEKLQQAKTIGVYFNINLTMCYKFRFWPLQYSRVLQYKTFNGRKQFYVIIGHIACRFYPNLVFVGKARSLHIEWSILRASLACKYQSSIEVTDSDKRTILLQSANNWCSKKFYNTSPCRNFDRNFLLKFCNCKRVLNLLR